MIQTINHYLETTYGIKATPGSAVKKYLTEVELDPNGLLTPRAEFICDCAYWCKQVADELEQTFTAYDFNRNQEPTGYGANIEAAANRLVTERTNEVASLYEKKGNQQSLIYDDTKAFANWPRETTLRGRLVRLINMHIPASKPKTKIAEEIGISAKTLKNITDYAYAKDNATQPSWETLEKLAEYMHVTTAYLVNGILPDPKAKYLSDALTEMVLNIRQTRYANIKSSIFERRGDVQKVIHYSSDIDIDAEINLLRRVYMFAPRREKTIPEEIIQAARAYMAAQRKR